MSNISSQSSQEGRPLLGARVVDLVEGQLGAIGHYLAEFGAEVLRVEPLGGAADRGWGLTVDGISLDFAAVNLGKQSIGIDLESRAGLGEFDDLVASADIVLLDRRPTAYGASQIDPARLRAKNPALVIFLVSDFGETEGFTRWRASDAVFHALSGELSRSGIPGREPLLPPGRLAESCAAAQAAFAVLSAYYGSLRTGKGDLLDFSILDGAIQALDPGFGIAGSATAGIPASKLPRGRVEARHQYPIIPCKDGFVRICLLAPRQWRGMFEWMGKPEEFADPSFDKLHIRFASKTLIPAIARFFATMTRAEIEAAAQTFGVPAAAVLSVEEAVVSPQMLARGILRPVEFAPGLTGSFPDGFAEIDGRRTRSGEPIGRPASIDNNAFDARPARIAKPDASAVEGLPLSGIKVLDLGVIVVGAEQGRLLGDLGADVIKVETSAFPDGSRQTLDGSALSVTFAAGHRNKRSLGLNLRHQDGKALFLKLVSQADVMLSNFKPGVLDNLGFDQETLRAVNPRLITADSSAFGPTGPWSGRLGYGPLVRASAGLTAAWRYPNEPDAFADALTVYPDHVAARVGVMGVLALLVRRERTNLGGSVSVSQAEVILGHMGAQVAALGLGKDGHRVENAERDAPSGVYPCLGDDEWCVVTVEGDEDWRRLCEAIGADDLLADRDLAHRAGRQAARQRIDAALSAWLAALQPHEAMERLQAAGIAAGAMMRVSELPDSAYFRARQFLCGVRHPQIAEPFQLEARPVKAENLQDPSNRPAPLQGEHSREVLTEWLDLPKEDIDHLIEIGAVEARA